MCINLFKNHPSKVTLNKEEEEEEAEIQEYFNSLGEHQDTHVELTSTSLSPSPPAPPPPPAPLWTPQTMQTRLDEIMALLQHLKNITIQPQIILIVGVQQLHPKNLFYTSNWLTRLHILFFEAKLSWDWVYKAVPDDDNDDDDDPNTVRLYLVNHTIKSKIMDTLQQYLSLQYNNSVYIL
jgi:hypothetical protein